MRRLFFRARNLEPTEKEVDVKGDASVGDDAAALVHRILSGMARTMTSSTLKAKLVSASARPLLLAPGQKTTDQISVLSCALKRVRCVLCTAARGETSVRRALSAYINNAAMQMHAQGGT